MDRDLFESHQYAIETTRSRLSERDFRYFCIITNQLYKYQKIIDVKLLNSDQGLDNLNNNFNQRQLSMDEWILLHIYPNFDIFNFVLKMSKITKMTDSDISELNFYLENTSYQTKLLFVKFFKHCCLNNLIMDKIKDKTNGEIAKYKLFEKLKNSKYSSLLTKLGLYDFQQLNIDQTYYKSNKPIKYEYHRITLPFEMSDEEYDYAYEIFRLFV